ncbi:hypothetical protein C8R42DRAFT_346670 [Lentinula raphanica]|nr:hypothetical protein C8R42DRAFT_346670 [Lentinula raphanica]
MHLSTMFVVSAIAASAVCALPLQDVPRSDPSTSLDVVSDQDPPANLDGSSVRVGAETSSLYPRGQCLSQSCCCCCSGDSDDDIQLTDTNRGGSRRDGRRRGSTQRGEGDDSRRSGRQRGERHDGRRRNERDDDRRRRRHRHGRPSSNAATYYDTSRSSLPTLSSQGAQGNTNNEGGPRRPPHPNPETPPISSHESRTQYGGTTLIGTSQAGTSEVGTHGSFPQQPSSSAGDDSDGESDYSGTHSIPETSRYDPAPLPSTGDSPVQTHSSSA